MLHLSLILFEVFLCLLPGFGDPLRRKVGGNGKAASRGRQRVLFEVQKLNCDFKKLHRQVGIGEIAIAVVPNHQGVSGDAFALGPPESDLPVPEAAFLVTLC